MSEYPYLIAIALVEQKDSRAMPIGGKALKADIDEKDLPGNTGKILALELLLRLIERSEENAIRRIAGERSLILVQIPMQEMQDQLPTLKAKWIATGNYNEFLEELKNITSVIWSLKFIKYKGIIFDRI